MITSGSGWFYSLEAVKTLNVKDHVGILKVGTTWPLPSKLLAKHMANVKRVLFVEEVDPFMENNVKELATEWSPEIGSWTFYGKNSGHVHPFGEINPDLIMLSGSVQGQTGPFAQHPGFGHLAQALTGINHVTGWPDRDPLGPSSATPDFIAPYYIVMALLTALEHRRQTGKGQYIDLSQLEVTAHFMAAGLLDAWFNSPGMTRRGNQSDDAAPHGIYPCKGTDRWCAIAVTTDGEWESFKRLVNDPRFSDPGFATFADRHAHHDELDAIVARWTATYDASELMSLLQAAGVAAGIVADGSDLAINSVGRLISDTH